MLIDGFRSRKSVPPERPPRSQAPFLAASSCVFGLYSEATVCCVWVAALGAADDKAVVATLVSKIGFNLQHRVAMTECIKKSMDLLFEFVAGVHIVHWISRAPELIVTGRLLLETPTGAYFLTDHCSAEFKFLSMRRYAPSLRHIRKLHILASVYNVAGNTELLSSLHFPHHLCSSLKRPETEVFTVCIKLQWPQGS